MAMIAPTGMPEDLVRKLNADLAAVKRSIDALAAQVASTRAAYRELVDQLAELDAQLADLEQQAADKAVQLEQRKAILAERLRAAYRTDRNSLLETLLSSNSFAEALTNIGYLADYANEDRKLADAIKSDQATLATIRTTFPDRLG